MPRTIRLGNQTRRLEATPDAVAVATRLLGDRDPRLVVLTQPNDFHVISCVTAALLYGEMGEKIAPKRVRDWIWADRKAGKFLEVKEAVVAELTEFYTELGLLDSGKDEEGDEQGEEKGPAESSP